MIERGNCPICNRADIIVVYHKLTKLNLCKRCHYICNTRQWCKNNLYKLGERKTIIQNPDHNNQQKKEDYNGKNSKMHL